MYRPLASYYPFPTLCKVFAIPREFDKYVSCIMRSVRSRRDRGNFLTHVRKFLIFSGFYWLLATGYIHVPVKNFFFFETISKMPTTM